MTVLDFHCFYMKCGEQQTYYRVISPSCVITKKVTFSSALRRPSLCVRVCRLDDLPSSSGKWDINHICGRDQSMQSSFTLCFLLSSPVCCSSSVSAVFKRHVWLQQLCRSSRRTQVLTSPQGKQVLTCRGRHQRPLLISTNHYCLHKCFWLPIINN